MYRLEKLKLVVSLLKEVLLIQNQLKGKDLADYAWDYIGVDASPNDAAPDELGCAESVTCIVRKKLSDFPIITGTWTLYDYLERDVRFLPVSTPKRGDIILSPTGMGNGSIVGHTGIMKDSVTIMSNTSATGTWEANYSLDAWTARYKTKGGIPVLFYRLEKA